ncbi:hypothetical protein L9W76_15510 [Vibrio aestuarianus]|uniref:hypothetical protein n=1 Tax=Vibrio aestuarianus TaxID=28171 RepID=UPI0021C411FC|nr:hypothetical protein [Vibrio aestuarianus]MDE1254555.1 hypothetical protein [Vibrio aestuarianus]MDE1319857.1 hypothetical protein [Vibrio aestuarianus]CAH8189306.1 conserved hypothetical protein [Vibrio aestuarianus]
MVNTKGEVITEIWKTAQELQQDIDLVKKPFDLWHSQNQTDEIETTPEDEAFEALLELYGAELASKKLALILDNCFDKPTYEDGGWVRS